MEAASIYLHDLPEQFRIEVRGRLDRAGAEEIRRAAATARSALNGRPLVVDLRRAGAVDGEAQAVLAELAGASFLSGDQHLPDLAAAFSRRPVLIGSAPLSRLRQACCALLERLRPGCACRFCSPQRVWSL